MNTKIEHTHSLVEGYNLDCDECEIVVLAFAEDLKILMVLYASARFTNTRQRLQNGIKLVKKAQAEFDKIESEIRSREWQELLEHSAYVANLAEAILDKYPKRSRSYKRPLLEFVMACYYHEFGILPDASMANDPDPKRYKHKVPNSPSTQFAWNVWREATALAKEELKGEVKMHKAINSRNSKALPDISEQSDRTMREILKAWNGKPPKPREIFPYEGDISSWSGE